MNAAKRATLKKAFAFYTYLCIVRVEMSRAPKFKKQYRPRIKGICTAAVELAVSRGHLRRVLNGERRSKSLSARFTAWQRQQRTKS